MMSLYLLVFSTVLAAGHAWLAWRISHYLGLEGRRRALLWAFMAIMFVLLMATMPLVRALPRDVISPIAWVTFGWMGVLMFAGMSFVAADLLHGLSHRVKHHDTWDGGRRRAFRRLLGVAALGSTGSLAGAAVAGGLRPVEVREVPVVLRRLPKTLDGTSIVQITDVHIGPARSGPWLEDVVDRINALEPDVIVITGDLVDGDVENLSEHIAPLARLKAAGGVYFITGNHEYYSGAAHWIEHLTTLGIRTLRNERIPLRLREGAGVIELAGVDDFSGKRDKGHGPDFDKALNGRDMSLPLVLLAHQPRAIHLAAPFDIDLQLSGHTHGGQIWPWNFMVYLQQPFVEGLHVYPGTQSQVYVSPGTGFWGPPMRLGTAAEITRIVLRSMA